MMIFFNESVILNQNKQKTKFKKIIRKNCDYNLKLWNFA